MDRSTPGLPLHHQLLEFTQTHVHCARDAIQSSHPLSSLSHPPSLFPSIRVFSHESVLPIRWPKYWSFSFSIIPSSENSGLISLGWTLGFPCYPRDSQESSPTPQFKSINSSVLSLMVQFAHLYMTTGKNIALTRQTLVSKVMSLLFNMLSRFLLNSTLVTKNIY